jgi:hypothetical protein
MNDLEQQLRDALKPRDPGDDFTAQVMARIAAGQAQGAATPRRSRGLLWPAALAASILLAFVGLQQLLEQRRQERAMAALSQLEQALEITSAELNQVQQRLNPEN